MQKTILKTKKSAAIVLIILMTFSATAISLPNTEAITYPDRPTGTFVLASPRLVGANQPVLINILVYPAPSGPTWYAQTLAISEEGFRNVTCTITAPDGTKSTFMPIDETLDHLGTHEAGLTEVVGSLQFYYTPTQVGNYSVSASFPGETFNAAILKLPNDTVYYTPSNSQKSATFTVQNDPVLGGILNGYPWSPLPTSYWERPVSTNNREWAAISGDWLQATYDMWKTSYNPYSTAPNSAHILWTRQIALGGIVGGEWGSLAYGSTLAGGGGTSYNPNIVLDGKLYQNQYNTYAGAGNGIFECIDLRNGKLLWTANGTLSMGQNLKPYYQTDAQTNEGGVVGILWDFGASTPGVWKEFDPLNGGLIYSLTNAPSGGVITVYGQEGNPIFYVLQYSGWNTTIPNKFANERMLMWNITKVNSVSDTLSAAKTTAGALTVSTNWQAGVHWNVSLRQPNGVGVGDGRTTVVLWPFPDANVVIATANNDEGYFQAYDATTGTYLYNATSAVPLTEQSGGPAGPYIVYDGATASWVAYDVKTGKQAWATPSGEGQWSALPQVESGVVNNGTWYIGSTDGHVYAFDLATGKVKWKSDYVGPSDETIYGNQPFNGNYISAGADGKLYFSTATIYGLLPRTRFHGLYCIDETTGHFLWNITIGQIPPSAIADGYLLGADGENGIEYAFNKGQTTMAVTGPTVTISAGTSTLIQGTILDQSPAQPNTPAISDSDMGTWMSYLHGQNATLINAPPTVHGVTVTLSAVDPNGNAVNIGTVASDGSGQYATSWTPTTPGLYTIYATFAGSNSYYSSYAETHLTVGSPLTPAPVTTTATTVSNSDLMTYLVVGIIAIIIAIAIVGALVLRKIK